MQKKNMIWIVGKKTDYIEKRIDRKRLLPDTEFLICRTVEDALDHLLAGNIPILMLVEPEYAIPPDSGTYIPAIGVVDFPRKKWKKEYADRCIPASMLSASLLNELVCSHVSVFKKNGGKSASCMLWSVSNQQYIRS